MIRRIGSLLPGRTPRTDRIPVSHKRSSRPPGSQAPRLISIIVIPWRSRRALGRNYFHSPTAKSASVGCAPALRSLRGGGAEAYTRIRVELFPRHPSRRNGIESASADGRTVTAVSQMPLQCRRIHRRLAVPLLHQHAPGCPSVAPEQSRARSFLEDAIASAYWASTPGLLQAPDRAPAGQTPASDQRLPTCPWRRSCRIQLRGPSSEVVAVPAAALLRSTRYSYTGGTLCRTESRSILVFAWTSAFLPLACGSLNQSYVVPRKSQWSPFDRSGSGWLHILVGHGPVHLLRILVVQMCCTLRCQDPV